MARNEGENLRQYADRLDTTLRKQVNTAAKKETRNYAKQKERRVAVKEKAKAKKLAKNTKQEDVDEEGGKNGFMEGVPFGFQVDAPPDLTKPRMVLKRVIEPGTEIDNDGEPVKKRKEQPKVDGPGRKVKLRDMGEGDKASLLAERDSAIDLYRKLKAERQKKLDAENASMKAKGDDKN
jgi:hypothetical protein